MPDQEPSPLASEYAAVESMYGDFAGQIAVLIGRLCANSSIGAEISNRAKTAESVERKVAAKKYTDLHGIPDLAGVRVIVEHLSDVQRVCALILQEFEVAEQDAHQFERPEAFGYASRHLVLRLSAHRSSLAEWAHFAGLKCEVQVRTILQHAWASISHSLDYKSNADAPAEIRRKLFQVAALIEVGDSLFESFRNDLSSIRDDYKSTASRGDAQYLPINIESLELTWEDWKPARLLDYLRKKRVTVVEESLEDPGFPDPSFMRQIISLTEDLGLENVGELAELLASDRTFKLFTTEFQAHGQYSLDFIALKAVYLLARAAGNEIPEVVERDRLDGPFD